MKDVTPHTSRRCEDLNQEGCVEAGRLSDRPVLGDTVSGNRIYPSGPALAAFVNSVKAGKYDL